MKATSEKIKFADVNGDGKADVICDDEKGNHWIRISEGKKFSTHELHFNNFCSHPGSVTQWADVNNDGWADMICDDLEGKHYIAFAKYKEDNIH